MITFGNKLKQLRKDKSISQIELAGVLSIHGHSISKYECGDQLPNAHILIAIADYFGVSIDWLLGRDKCV